MGGFFHLEGAMSARLCTCSDCHGFSEAMCASLPLFFDCWSEEHAHDRLTPPHAADGPLKLIKPHCRSRRRRALWSHAS
jgi:hypothetical protein